MKILQVAPTYVSTPPTTYGGIETMVALLSQELSKRGHDVTIYAAAGSKLPGVKIKEVTPYPTIEHPENRRYWEVQQMLEVLRDQHQFDLIHFHIEPKFLAMVIDNYEFNLLNLLEVPTVITMHNTTYIDENIAYYKQNQFKTNFVFISEDQRQPLSHLTNSQVIYHGLDLTVFTPNPNFEHEDYLLFLGRISADKGAAEAIEIARKTKHKLILAGNVDFANEEYFNEQIKPNLDQNIQFIGEVNLPQKIKLYRNALALLFPIKWHEPFGLVMIEALACGCPVIGFASGSVPEIIDYRKSGFVVKDIPEMLTAVRNIGQIERTKCREIALQRFDLNKMVEEYLAVYTNSISH